MSAFLYSSSVPLLLLSIKIAVPLLLKLYPVVAICGAGCLLAGSYIAYMLKAKTDIRLVNVM